MDEHMSSLELTELKNIDYKNQDVVFLGLKRICRLESDLLLFGKQVFFQQMSNGFHHTTHSGTGIYGNCILDHVEQQYSIQMANDCG